MLNEIKKTLWATADLAEAGVELVLQQATALGDGWAQIVALNEKTPA